MKLIYKSVFLVALSVFTGCDNDFEEDVNDVVVTNGDADFSTYVALGNSLTSGYSDGALYKSGQENSYPSVIASKMQLANGGIFTQPLMPDDIGGFTDIDLKIPGKLQLQFVNGSAVPVYMEAQQDFASTFVSGKFNNMAVPGAKSFHLVAPGYGNPQGVATGMANPYFARFASSPGTTIINDAMTQAPTFFTLWIGNNDVLSYATSGGVGVNQTGNLNPATYGSTDITSPAVVANVINSISEAMVNSGAKGALANIPEVTSIPFFTTVPAKPLSPLNSGYASQIPTLNEFYSSINQVFVAIGAADRKISFDSEGPSGIVFVDDSLENLAAQIAGVLIQTGMDTGKAQLLGMIFGQARQSKEGDLIPLTMSSRIGKLDTDRVGYLMSLGLPQDDAGLLSIVGLTYPADEFVLSNSEVNEVLEATGAINASIEQIASVHNLAFVDMNGKMKELQAGILYEGVTYTTTFVTGGAFSLDGVHLNGRGYAVVANTFIDAINMKYNSTLPQENPNSHPGTILP